MTKSEIAVAKMAEGFNCAQAVVAAFAADVKLDEATALKLTGAFGGGLAHQGHVCGAVSGAFVIIGMKCIAPETGIAAREEGYRVGEAFINAFKTRNVSVDCRDLIGCDLSTNDGLQRFKDEGLYQKVCCKWVSDAVAILESLLAQQVSAGHGSE